MGDFVKIGPFKIFKIITLFCRVFYGLSENWKIIKIEQSKLKLAIGILNYNLDS